MDLDFENYCIYDYVDNSAWSTLALNRVFGSNWDSPLISQAKIFPEENSHWVWFPKTKNNKISIFIYDILNSNNTEIQHWHGWSNIWKLNVAPKVKTFTQLLIQGKIKTYDYLYQLNLGPLDPCVLCGLVTKTTDLFRQCSKGQTMRIFVEEMSILKITISKHIYNGNWLNFQDMGNSRKFASLIAPSTWYIWKARCDLISNKKPPDFIQMAKNVIEHTKEFMVHTKNYKMLKYFQMNRLKPGALGFFAVAAWNEQTSKGGEGFMTVDSNANILCAGAETINISWRVEMEVVVIMSALKKIRECNGRCSNIYTSSNELWKMFQGNKGITQQDSYNQIDEFRQCLSIMNNPNINLIHHSWNNIAVALAS